MSVPTPPGPQDRQRPRRHPSPGVRFLAGVLAGVLAIALAAGLFTYETGPMSLTVSGIMFAIGIVLLALAMRVGAEE